MNEEFSDLSIWWFMDLGIKEFLDSGIDGFRDLRILRDFRIQGCKNSKGLTRPRYDNAKLLPRQRRAKLEYFHRETLRHTSWIPFVFTSIAPFSSPDICIHTSYTKYHEK